MARSLRASVGKRGFVLMAAVAGAALATSCLLETGEAPAEEVETVSGALTGDLIFETTFAGQEGTCQNASTVESRVRAGYTRGRIGARSRAFLQCMATAVSTGIPRIMTGGGSTGLVGPFIPCLATSQCDLPWLRTATAPERTAWFLSMSSSPMKLRARCDGRTGLTGDSGGMMVKNEDGIPQGIEGLRIVSIGTNPSKTGGLMWHEVTHNHACGSHPEFDACGYTRSQYDNGDNAATGIIGGCMSEVLQQSAASAACAALSCPAGEQAIIREYGQTACECVPDVFNWPANENEANDTFGYAMAKGNFNGDAYDDLAVSAVGENGGRGVVYVFRGSDYGLLYWKRVSQANITAVNYSVSTTPFSPGEGANDHFGWSLAAGDLNGDGFDELVVGTPDKNFGAGLVYIFGGSSGGLSFTNVQALDQTANGGGVESGDLFGYSMTVGNFNGDAFKDLAVGAPEEVYGGARSGIVSIHRGRSAVAGQASLVVSEGFVDQTPNHSNEDGDEFGTSVAFGDIDGDGLDELIIGAPGENNAQGYVFRAKKAPSWVVNLGLTRTGASRFGETLAIGDIVGSSTKDLVIGSPVDQGTRGSVWIWRGASGGDPIFNVQLSGDETDRIGFSLAIGNIRGSSKPDLIVGAPGEEFGSGPREGRALIYLGTTSTTFVTSFDAYFFQGDFVDAGSTDTALPPEQRGADSFGGSAVVGNFNGAGTGVAIGAPFDENAGVTAAGAVFTFSNELRDGRKFDQRTARYGKASPPY